MTRRPDAVIVGGGVIGCALARELALSGVTVTLLERGEPGGEASGAAAGMLTPQSEAIAPGPFSELALESRDLYPDWVAGLEAETGLAVGFRRTGLLRCAFAEERSLDRFLWQREAGLRVEECDARAIAAKSGNRVAKEIERALFFPDEALVDARRLTRALCAAAERRGVAVRSGTRAERLLFERGVCRGVETARERIEAGAVIDCAGAWSGFETRLPFPVPVEPVRGELVELEFEGAPPPAMIESDDVYLVPHADGSVLAGATAERVGFDSRVTAAGVARLLDAAARLVPSTASARFAGARGGLRPGSPDGLPLLGPTPVAGFFVATGHFRNGILLAPITARLVSAAVLGRATRDLSAFAVERFADGVGATSADSTKARDDFR